MARLDFAELPSDIRERVEQVAGAPVHEAATQSGGFSAGVASRVSFIDGQRLFVKAVPASAEGTFELYQREAAVLRAIPRDLPAAHLVDAFTQGEWTVLVIEDVEGRHPKSSSAEDTRHVLDSLAALIAASTDADLPSLGDELAGDALSWGRLEEEGLLETTTPWCQDNFAFLRAAGERVASAVAGDRLIHGDLRADNMLIDAAGHAHLLDWPWACRGAGWVDAFLYLLDVQVADAAADVTPFLDHPVFAGARTEDQISLLSAISGAWFEKCRWPAPPGMTTLREFQRREAITSVEWITRLAT